MLPSIWIFLGACNLTCAGMCSMWTGFASGLVLDQARHTPAAGVDLTGLLWPFCLPLWGSVVLWSTLEVQKLQKDLVMLSRRSTN